MSESNETTLLERELAATVRAGLFRNEAEAVREVLDTFFAAKPHYRIEAALAMWKADEVSLERAAEIAGMNGEINHHAGAPKRLRILIADDSAAFRNAFSLFLDRLPQVELVGAAEDGKQALTLVSNLRPDLVLMDLQMPRLNGLQAARKIRAEFPGVRVIMITLHDSEELRAASAAAGAERFIPSRNAVCARNCPARSPNCFPAMPAEGRRNSHDRRESH